MNAFIRLLYALAIAGAVVAFVSVGVYSFSQPPKYPDYPSCYTTDQACNQQQTDYNNRVSTYNTKNKHYYHNVTYFALPATFVISVLGLLVLRGGRYDVIGEGIALGGAATGIYSVVVASIAGANKLRFVAVTLLLLSLLAIAHQRFNEKSTPRLI